MNTDTESPCKDKLPDEFSEEFLGESPCEPLVLGGVASWKGADLKNSNEWTHHWSEEMLAALDSALSVAQGHGLVWYELNRRNFCLASIEDELKIIADQLENGRGIIRLRGLPIELYNRDQLKMIYYGLGNWIGTPVFQNARGELLGEICDEGPDVGLKRGQLISENGDSFYSARSRAQSTQPLRWHTDRTDVVGLLCLGQPASGGESRLVSSVAVQDEMIRRHPDLAALLYEELERSHLGEELGGENLTYSIPVWGVQNGKFASHYSRTYVEAAQLIPGIKKLSEKKWQALDMLAQISDELCLEMSLIPGDIQLINNHIIYHSRNSFRDDPTSDKRRLLYRLWLSMPNSRQLPKGYEVLFSSTEAGALRGGIRQGDCR
ncbi:MAG: hypothetical protein GKR95_06975 [Gammaproteobacteria bacterium]|nr:hypothetical protein [Gammaproteobacteria bacterium]